MSWLPRLQIGRHRLFYFAVLMGGVATGVAALFQPTLEFAAAGDAFFLSYIVLMLTLAARASPTELRSLASTPDEGVLFITLITLAAIVFSLISIFTLLGEQPRHNMVRLVLSVLSAPLGWAMLHMLAAFHYAHVFYTAEKREDSKRADVGGFKFPATDEPKPWDFLYVSFVIGTSTQVSDVQVTNNRMRRLVMAQSVTSFFFNTVLIALAVNIVVVLAQ